jgi:hypothetical protein
VQAATSDRSGVLRRRQSAPHRAVVPPNLPADRSPCHDGDDLEQFLHLVHTRYVDPCGLFMLNDIGMISDAESLVKGLKESTYFHRALDDHTLTQ